MCRLMGRIFSRLPWISPLHLKGGLPGVREGTHPWPYPKFLKSVRSDSMRSGGAGAFSLGFFPLFSLFSLFFFPLGTLKSSGEKEGGVNLTETGE